jgi:universal stress protein F
MKASIGSKREESRVVRTTTIGQVMTPAPHTIGSEQKLAYAHKVMRENGLRHLPVLRSGKLIGVLSQRDLYFLETISGVDIDIDKVADAMSPDVFTTPPDQSLREVARVMAELTIMNKILVCLDASPRAPHVLAAAVDLARRTKAKLTLFRSVGLPPELAHDDVFGVSPNKLVDRLLDTAKEELMRHRADVPDGLVEAVEVRVGTPWDAICSEAKNLHADLIMIGSHGYSGFDRILGTTAAKVVNHAECSVLVVR